tara:strand:+ start:2069 stop:2332 length:264 start_codon:yes stop_codon:yes gene_type:complete
MENYTMGYGSEGKQRAPPMKAPAKRKPTPPQVPAAGANKLSSAILTKLQEHKKQGHSAKHMAKMRVLLKEGRSFSQSHAMAMKLVGK